MALRVRRKKKVFTKNIGAGYTLKMRLLPLIHTENGSVWLASLVVARGKRQINDWLMRRLKRRSVKQLNNALTNRMTLSIQRMVINTLRKWVDELPEGDSISFRCESAQAIKQFLVWGKWLQRKEKVTWTYETEFLSFFYYKKRSV